MKLSVFLTGFLVAFPAWAGEFTVRETEVEDMKAVFATVETADVVTARTRIAGTVTELSVDEGSKVRAGQVIARIVDAKLRLQLKSLAAKIESLRSKKDLAETTLARVERLFQTGTGTKVRLDEAKSNLRVVGREMAAMTAERGVILQRQAEGAVKAPAEGRIMKVHLTEGAVVLPGETVATIAARAYILRLQLPERHARFIKQGDTVIVGGREGGESDARRTGKVIQVYPEMKLGRVIADVDVEGLDGFFVGERVRVYVGAGMRRTFVVPAEYLFKRHGLTFIRLKHDREVVVQPGVAVKGGVEVLSGLRNGDVLVTP